MQGKIVVDRISHSFDSQPVLQDVEFQVHEHEMLCVLGPSGGGKTTLLRVMAGLIEPTKGKVRLDGREVLSPSPRMAIVFQHFGLFPWRSVRENIGYGLETLGKRNRERVEHLLEIMGLQDAADKYPYQLSGGMQQRVGLARALAVDPEVLLMDEPFGALDALTREQLQDELLWLWERDAAKTAVFVTHDIDEALLLGDRIIVLLPNPGRVGDTIEVTIPRPRTARGLRSHPAYPALREQVWQALRSHPAIRKVGLLR